MIDHLFESDDVRDKISDYLAEKGTPIAWLSRHLNISRSSMSRILSKERPLTQENLDIINTVLKTDFTL